MPVEKIKLKDNKELKIYQDLNAESPRTAWDNVGKMICFHRGYNLGDKHNIKTDQYENFDEMIECVVGNGVWLPLFLYDHGGITMSTGAFGCRWDSGQVGFIYMSAQDIRREYGNANAESRDRALKLLQSEVDVYDQYLTGQVYGYVLVEKYTDNRGYEREEEIDSCWGFYGSDHDASGLLEQAGVKKQDVA